MKGLIKSRDTELEGKQIMTISFQHINKVTNGTVQGILYLHQECTTQIVHYDIKPENILLDNNINLKM